MKISCLNFRPAILGFSLSVFVWVPTLTSANNIGAGDIADIPLFASFSVESNVFFMLDDSGSMHWEITSRQGSPGATQEGKVRVNASSQTDVFDEYEYVFAGLAENTEDDNRVAPTLAGIEALNSNEINDRRKTTFAGIWRVRNSDFNRTYYDPTRTYQPWSGRNTNNQVFGPADPERALIDPFFPNGTTYNLTADQNNARFDLPEEQGENCGNDEVCNNRRLNYFPATYWTWSPSGANDTTVDPDEEGMRYEIRPTNASGNATVYPKASSRTDCTSQPNYCSYNEEIQNFANWFQYHSRREFAMKAAVSEVVSNATGVRMGLSTLHQNDDNGAVANPVASMTPDNSSNNPDQAKDNLLRGLFRIHSERGTPLRSALESVGEYYTCSGGNAGGDIFDSAPCPIEVTGENPAGECQQNFAILFSDGFWNNDQNFNIGNHDGPGNGNTTFDGAPYADTHSNTLADVAMSYYEGDLSSLPNRVPITCGQDENSAQHMVTYTIGFGVEGTIPADRFPEQPSGLIAQCTANQTPTTPFLDIDGDGNADSWPEPVRNEQTAVDDMLHAAYNGRGEFFAAQSSEQLAVDLQATIQSISDRSGTTTAASFNSSSLRSGATIFTTEFNTTDWSGDVVAFRLNPNNGNLRATPRWSAANTLDQRNWQSRRAWSANGNVAGESGGIRFRWQELNQQQRRDLRTNPDGSLGSNAIGRARVRYILGETDNEVEEEGTFQFRNRGSRLGDIIQSTPVFVGRPSLPWPDVAPFPDAPGERYSDFRASLSEVIRDADTNLVTEVRNTRREGDMLYVGANDGMLHAFDADNGIERFAYIPSYFFSEPGPDGDHPAAEGLHYLTDPDYSHRFYHDLEPTVSDIYVNGEWKTILIGGHRAGARGLFALDITSRPGGLNFRQQNPLMWEFRGETGADPDHPLGDEDLGYSFSRPVIALTNATKNGQHRWAAIFGNGYNQTGSAEAQLFMVFLDADLSNGWSEGTDYIKLTTKEDGGQDFNNGLSSPALVDLDGNGTADRVYAGDLAGNMWAFDICARDNDGDCATTVNGDDKWDVAHGSSLSPEPLYRGVTVNGATTQHITTQPQIIRNPVVNNSEDNAPNLLVLFGTGRYFSNGDGLIENQQSFYGIWDAGTSEITSDQLLSQTLEDEDLNGRAIRTVTDNPIQYSEPGDNLPGDDLGWRVSFPDDSERNISNALVRDDIVFFSTLIPSTSSCDAGGQGFIMFLDVENGGEPDRTIIDINNDGMFDSQDMFGTNEAAGISRGNGIAAPSFLGDNLYSADPINNNNEPNVGRDGVAGLSSQTGRISWEEIFGPIGNPSLTNQSNPATPTQ